MKKPVLFVTVIIVVSAPFITQSSQNARITYETHDCNYNYIACAIGHAQSEPLNGVLSVQTSSTTASGVSLSSYNLSVIPMDYPNPYNIQQYVHYDSLIPARIKKV